MELGGDPRSPRREMSRRRIRMYLREIKRENAMKNRLKNLKFDPKTFATDVIFDIIGCVLYGAGIYNFAYTANFAPGGVSGLSILINILTRDIPFFHGGISIGLAMILINIPIVIFCITIVLPSLPSLS